MESEAGAVSVTTALVLSLASTVVLMALHLLAPHVRRLPVVPERATGSFAGGLAVAYVFLHLLPELARGSRELRELFGEEGEPSALVEFALFVVALVGFLVFYTLERVAERSKDRRAVAVGTTPGAPTDERSDRSSAAGDRSGGGAAPPAATQGGAQVFWVHLGFFALYNAIITYTLPSTYRTGIVLAVLFTVAMALHFLLSDRGLEEHYGDQFDRRTPRLVLAGALLIGWALAAVVAPTRAVTVSVLIAFLAGGVLLNVFKEEIPSGRQSSLRWFTIGLVLYALLLGAITALEASGGE